MVIVTNKKSNLRDRLDDCTLDLSMMEWEDVPVKDIALIKKGTNLDLSMNKILNLGNNFATLTHITRLDLSKNLLESLPDNFGDLILLKHLDLYSNRLTHLPLSVGKLKALRWLDLKDNPLVPVLAEKAGQCLDPKQCQACARVVVTFLGDMQQQVDDTKMEMEKKREEAQKKEDEQKVKEENISKKKKKSAKSKAEKKKENGVKTTQQATSEDKAANLVADVKPVVISLKQANKQAQGGSCLTTLFKLCSWSLLAVMLSVNALLVLRAMDRPRFDALQTHSAVLWSAFVDKLPAQVRESGSQAAEAATPKIQEAWQVISYGGQQLFLKIQDGYTWVSANDFWQTCIVHARSIIDSVYTRVAGMYRSMS